ncbi:hypothetical protein G4B88_015337 [Cannabis sativa]|uniref:Uncharacterized protein n=1 Tax=Cannabis sativa TaxID=3483 RepID=A0A7J6EC93_CANSA|nr:hypothetical protein G4B88_015337 [Cannabis sativa]
MQDQQSLVAASLFLARLNFDVLPIFHGKSYMKRKWIRETREHNHLHHLLNLALHVICVTKERIKSRLVQAFYIIHYSQIYSSLDKFNARKKTLQITSL